MTTSDFHITTARVVRLLMTIVFLLLAMTKTYILAELGFKPYEAIVKAAALPGIIKYYGIIALLIEFYLVFGLWNKRHYQAAILLGLCLTVAGALLSLVLLMFKINSDCGCGLLGGSEYGFMVQKMVIIFGLVILYKNQDRLFQKEKTIKCN